MHCLVTGASGHIGGNLVRDLLARGDRVRVLVRRDRRAIDGLPVEAVSGDVEDRASLAEAARGMEVVFHCAARISIVGDEGGLVHRTNVEGTRNVVGACAAAGVRRLVHFSSIHAFDPHPRFEPLDETRPLVGDGAAAYDRSKAAGVRVVDEAVARGLDAVIVHPTSVVGPHDYKPSRMGQAVWDLARGRLPMLIPGGFDWVDVRDVCAGALAAADRGRRGERYLLSGTWTTVAELARRVAVVSGVPAPRLTCPSWLARVGSPFVVGWARLVGGSPLYTSEALDALDSPRDVRHEKASGDLGYAPRPLDDTVRDTVAFFLKGG